MIFNEVTSATTERSVVFVDEVQKCEAVFDALKFATDRGGISFVVSGSNPAYLDTVAKRRLQRRADYLTLSPFSLPEVLVNAGHLDASHLNTLESLLSEPATVAESLPRVSRTPELSKLLAEYFEWGGLPLVYLTRASRRKLLELRCVIERGFEPMSTDSDNRADIIRVELASLHSREFTYKSLFHKTGLKRRDAINGTIDELVNHGYLVAKRPLILDPHRRSYLVVYSYTDPGMVTFLKAGMNPESDAGHYVEGYVHTRLAHYVTSSPMKTSLHYFKPYIISENRLKFLAGEVDFIVKSGDVLLPIEVKARKEHGSIDTRVLERLIADQGLRIGLVLYGGVPFWDRQRRILFWPYWLI